MKPDDAKTFEAVQAPKEKRSIFLTDITDAHRHEFYGEIARINLYRSRVSLILLLVFALFFLIMDKVYEQQALSVPNPSVAATYHDFFYPHLLYLILAVVFLIVFNLKAISSRNTLSLTLTSGLMPSLILLNTLLTSVFVHIHGGRGIDPYIIVLFLVGGVIFIPPWPRIIIFGTIHALFLGTLFVFLDNPERILAHLIYGTIMAGFVFILNRFTWKHQLGLFTQHKIINNQLDEIRHLSITDPLTGAFNRRQFSQSLEDALYRFQRYGSTFSLIIFDIDDFKKINDRWGHQVGDQVLAQIAEAVTQRIRRLDIFSRWGGEEFAILTPETGLAIAAGLAEQLRNLIASHAFSKGVKAHCSFGITSIQPGDDFEEVIRRADDALYRAKSEGKNRVIVG